MDFQFESEVNAADFEEASAERTAGEAGFGQFREEPATADQNVAGAARNHRYLINAVLSVDFKASPIRDRLELDALTPGVGRPGIEDRACRMTGGPGHFGYL